MFPGKIDLFKTLFRGREDIFAQRWEKGGKASYSPQYIWHIVKDKQELRNQLQVIDRQLNIIRNDGRQVFLESQPVNFSRVLHDYSDEQKGFILCHSLSSTIHPSFLESPGYRYGYDENQKGEQANGLGEGGERILNIEQRILNVEVWRWPGRGGGNEY
jgi:hypothetical protein